MASKSEIEPPSQPPPRMPSAGALPHSVELPQEDDFHTAVSSRSGCAGASEGGRGDCTPTGSCWGPRLAEHPPEPEQQHHQQQQQQQQHATAPGPHRQVSPRELSPGASQRASLLGGTACGGALGGRRGNSLLIRASLEERVEEWMRSLDEKLDAMAEVFFSRSGALTSPRGSAGLSPRGSHVMDAKASWRESLLRRGKLLTDKDRRRSPRGACARHGQGSQLSSGSLADVRAHAEKSMTPVGSRGSLFAICPTSTGRVRGLSVLETHGSSASAVMGTMSSKSKQSSAHEEVIDESPDIQGPAAGGHLPWKSVGSKPGALEGPLQRLGSDGSTATSEAEAEIMDTLRTRHRLFKSTGSTRKTILEEQMESVLPGSTASTDSAGDSPIDGRATDDVSEHSRVSVTSDPAARTLHRSDTKVSRASRQSRRAILDRMNTIVSAMSGVSASPEPRKETDPEISMKLRRRMDSLKIGKQPREKSILGSIIASGFFDTCITGLVVLNALLIGAHTQHMAINGGDSDTFFFYAERVCTLIFALELTGRVLVHGRSFYTDPRDKYWNVFDAFLVGVSLLDLFIDLAIRVISGSNSGGLPGSGATLGKLLRVLRMARVMRVLRTVRFVSELRVMVQMIVTSMLSLFWVLVVLLAVIYVFSIILTTGATEYLNPGDGERPQDYLEVSQSFGSLFETMYTLYQTMSGGVDWGEVSVLMRGPGWVYEAVIVCYTFFTIFAVVNIVTGVFVDGAIELAKRDRTVLMQKQAKDLSAQEGHLLGLLQAMDNNGDELITADEFKEALQRQDVREFIAAMQVEVADAAAFFDLLDQDGSGEVDIVEFVTGMMRLRGEAKSVDIHMMLHENKKMLRMVTGLVDLMGGLMDDEDDEAMGSRRSSMILEAGDLP